jgi:hypothetical protein
MAIRWEKTDGSTFPAGAGRARNLAVSGNLAVVTVDGVDISVLKNNYDTHLGDPLGHNYIRNLLDDSDVAAPKGGVTNDVRIYGDGDITVTKTVDGLLIALIAGGGVRRRWGRLFLWHQRPGWYGGGGGWAGLDSDHG